jgi:hypothetical protein
LRDGHFVANGTDAWLDRQQLTDDSAFIFARRHAADYCRVAFHGESRGRHLPFSEQLRETRSDINGQLT